MTLSNICNVSLAASISSLFITAIHTSEYLLTGALFGFTAVFFSLVIYDAFQITTFHQEFAGKRHAEIFLVLISGSTLASCLMNLIGISIHILTIISIIGWHIFYFLFFISAFLCIQGILSNRSLG